MSSPGCHRPAGRGVPSLVWRAGQERRWAMMRDAAGDRLGRGRILDVGCGVGMYMRAFRTFTSRVFGVEIEGEHARAASTLPPLTGEPELSGVGFLESARRPPNQPPQPPNSGGSQRPDQAFPPELGGWGGAFGRAEGYPWKNLPLKGEPEGGGVIQSPAEMLPFADGTFDLVLSHEVIEHVADDRASVAEMVRVLGTGGRLLLFCPNRLYPFETHGHYWRGEYRFGNTPLINYLPDRLRNRLAPHVRAYTTHSLRALFAGLPVSIILHTQIYPGYDNVVARRPALGRWLRWATYSLEQTPLRAFGLSHFLVAEKTPG